MLEEDNNAFTYDTVFDILRKERSSESLQRLEQSFYSNLVNYIKEKEGIGDKDLLYNVRKMLREIYERREKKIVSLAIDRCRLGIESINASNMLKEERELYEQMLNFLIIGRKAILDMLLSGRLPETFQVDNDVNVRKESKESKSIPSVKDNSDDEVSKPSLDTGNVNEHPSLNKSVMLRFLYAVPRFVGKELEIYGPYDVEDMATVPTEIAHLLIAKGRAEEIKER